MVVLSSLEKVSEAHYLFIEKESTVSLTFVYHKGLGADTPYLLWLLIDLM